MFNQLSEFVKEEMEGQGGDVICPGSCSLDLARVGQEQILQTLTLRPASVMLFIVVGNNLRCSQ